MLNGTPWRRWLNQRSALPEGRPFWQRARLDESFQDYRAICRYILLLDYNWRLGKYEESSLTLLNDVDDVIISGKHVYCFINDGNSQPMIILDKTCQVRTKYLIQKSVWSIFKIDAKFPSILFFRECLPIDLTYLSLAHTCRFNLPRVWPTLV